EGLPAPVRQRPHRHRLRLVPLRVGRRESAPGRAAQPGPECAPGDGQASWPPRADCTRVADRPACVHRGARHWSRDSRRGTATHLRSVLHDQAAGRGERPWSVRLLRDRRRAGRRAPGREPRDGRRVVHRRAAARGAPQLTVRLVAALLLVLITIGCTSVGGSVPGAPAHHRERGFANVTPSYEPASFWTRFTFFISRMWSATFSARTASFPSIASDLPAIRDNRGGATVT